MDKLIFQPIHTMRTTMKDNNVKFRTFVCLAMSKGMLTGWLEALPKQRSEGEGGREGGAIIIRLLAKLLARLLVLCALRCTA